MMICKNTIKKRKAIYGSNFDDIATLWSAYIESKNFIEGRTFTQRLIIKACLRLVLFVFRVFKINIITPKDVSKMMALMKQVRINFTNNKLQELKKSEDFNTALVLAEVQTLNYGLEDSKRDYENYNWIAENFEEYEGL